MNEIVTSKFSIFFYARTIGGGVICLALLAVFIYAYTYDGKLQFWTIAYIAGICIVVLFLYIYTLINNTLAITISPDELIVNYLVSKKQIAVSYDELVSANTYRFKNNDSRYGATNYQSFKIEYKNGKTISLSAGDYDNYDELKAAIYKYKYGIGL